VRGQGQHGLSDVPQQHQPVLSDVGIKHPPLWLPVASQPHPLAHPPLPASTAHPAHSAEAQEFKAKFEEAQEINGKLISAPATAKVGGALGPSFRLRAAHQCRCHKH